VFYGDGAKRMALVSKSVIEYHGEEGERPQYEHSEFASLYNGDQNRLRYPFVVGPDSITGSEDEIIDCMERENKYNKKPAFITIREDAEYSTGHRMVKQVKIKSELSAL